MQVFRHVCRLIVMGSVAAGLAGCAAPVKPPKPEKMAAEIVAVADLNPDYSGRPSPVVLRIYQLRAAGAFNAADFFALYAQPEAVLAADLVASDEFTIQPGENRAFEAQFDPATRWVAVVAAYRDIENARWRDVAELPEDKLIDIIKKNRLRVDLSPLAVSVSVGKPQ